MNKPTNMIKEMLTTHIITHFFWLIKIHMRPSKFIWDAHDLVWPMLILTNQKECVAKCVLLAFLI